VGGPSPAERAFLERRRVAHLATADPAGRPHVVPVCFALGDDVAYIVLDLKPKRGAPGRLKRVRNILANPRAALVADVYDDADWSRLGFVLVTGPARLLTEGAEHARALALLRRRYRQYQAMPLEERPVIALALEHVASWGALDERPAG
jgi:coenzyme F420-0:L-glutamate ligase / coenzyme F420-1:gamma-L-glutamate ligase